MSRDQVKFSLQKYPIVHILNFTRHPSYLSPRYFLVPLPRPHPLTRFPPATSSAVAGHVLWSPPTSFSGPSPSSFLAFSSPRAGPSTSSGSTDCKSHRRHLFRQLSATAVTNLVHLLLLNVDLLLNRTLKAASPLFPELPVHILSPMCSAAAGNMLSSPATCCWPRHLSLTFPDPRSTLGGILLPSTGPYSNPRRDSFVSPPPPQPALPASSVQWGLPPPDQFLPTRPASSFLPIVTAGFPMLYPSFDCFHQRLTAVAATRRRLAGTAPGRPPRALVVHPRPALIEASLS